MVVGRTGNVFKNKNMKAILEFNLENNEDRVSHLQSIKAKDMANAIFEIGVNLKKKATWRAENLEKDEIVDFVFEMIHEIFNENDLDPEKLV